MVLGGSRRLRGGRGMLSHRRRGRSGVGACFLFWARGLISYGEEGVERRGGGGRVGYAMKFVSPSVWVMRIPI